MNPNIKYIRVNQELYGKAINKEVKFNLQDFANDIAYIRREYYGGIWPYKYYIEINNERTEV